MAVGWKRLPKKSRRRCGEIVGFVENGEAMLGRCSSCATWAFGNLGFRCDPHKESLIKYTEMVKAAAKSAFSSVAK